MVVDDNGGTIEVWYAREFQELLGYARWENFTTAMDRAIASFKSQDINSEDHFRGVTKMVKLGSGRIERLQNFLKLINEMCEWEKFKLGYVCRKQLKSIGYGV